MKKTTLVFSTVLALFFISCEGPAGPPGLDGFDGADGAQGPPGPEFEAIAFEIDIDMVLNADLNRYEFALEPFPDDVILLQDDVVLMYRLEEVNNDLDVWRQLPQPFFSDQGLLFYNFDFTLNDYSVLVEPEFDAGLVPADLVQNQVFRIVVIPADLGLSSKMDKSNIDAVMRSLGIEEKDIKKIQLD
ncbi:collagen-like triple helix repeat-containing protein [Ulvibacterium marinum]|uniref:Collagen-like protein n=1 Tax=Ulvibacterium marinum TaxID=2419782 RepID=A0A3B0BYU3_9FLAO|nr:collagen-like protein [Ulvibacterium marinum]RKN78040.1 collagen-like protein [Ulvibacterium marinum]